MLSVGQALIKIVSRIDRNQPLKKGSSIAMEFNEYLSQKGMSNSEQLIVFLEQFDNSPGMIFQLTDNERDQMEEQMEEALSLLLA